MKCQSPLTVVFAFSAKIKALSSPVPKKKQREMERRKAEESEREMR